MATSQLKQTVADKLAEYADSARVQDNTGNILVRIRPDDNFTAIARIVSDYDMGFKMLDGGEYSALMRVE